jgi:hypothetical protein
VPDPAPIACFSNAYQFFKDFAQPIATTIGAIAVAYFACKQSKIAGNQVKIALFQSELAHDRLRFDLFNKRYAIFDGVKTLLKTILGNDWTHNSDRTKVNDLMNIIDEATFFFSTDETEMFVHISNVVDNYLDTQKEFSLLTSREDDARATVVTKLNQHMNALTVCQRKLPKIFTKALSFPTLEGRSPPV